MSNRTRSWRRHQKDRAESKARYRARIMGVTNERWIKKSTVTPCPCSCHMCGNPRAYGMGGKLQDRNSTGLNDW